VVFARLHPSAVQPFARPLPVGSEEPAFGPAATSRRLSFRPRGFSPPRRLAPRRRSRVCCAPLPAWGFVAFPGRPTGWCSRKSPPDGGAVPRDAVRTLRRVPLVNSRAASLRPLPSCRCHSISSRRPRPMRRRCDPVHGDPTLPSDDAPIRRGEPPLHRSRRCAGRRGGRAAACRQPGSRASLDPGLPGAGGARRRRPALEVESPERLGPDERASQVGSRANPGPCRGRSALEGWPRRRMPLPESAFGAAPAEQPTTGLCSVDESVATHRRCQRRVARSSHGLCSPSRSSVIRSRPVNRGARRPRVVGFGGARRGESRLARAAGIPPSVSRASFGRSRGARARSGGRSRSPPPALFRLERGPRKGIRRARRRSGGRTENQCLRSLSGRRSREVPVLRCCPPAPEGAGGRPRRTPR